MNVSLVNNNATEPVESFSVVLQTTSDLVDLLRIGGESYVTILDDDCESSK